MKHRRSPLFASSASDTPADTDTNDRTPTPHRGQSAKLLRSFRSTLRSLPSCHRISSNSARRTARATGTLFAHRKSGITLAIQETPRADPTLVLELAVPTVRFLTGAGSSGTVRIAFECEKRAFGGGGTRLLDEPVWSMFVNGKNAGPVLLRDATDADLRVMRTLRAVSTGVGVLPAADDGGRGTAYMRARFRRAVGSEDSETFHMINPDLNSSTELSIFFIRI